MMFLFWMLQGSSLEVRSVELRGGRAKCPYDPSSNYTIIFVGTINAAYIPQYVYILLPIKAVASKVR